MPRMMLDEGHRVRAVAVAHAYASRSACRTDGFMSSGSEDLAESRTSGFRCPVFLAVFFIGGSFR